MTIQRPSKARQKRAGLTPAELTAGAAGLIDAASTALTPKPKRKYKARARKCKHCKTCFTPKRNSAAKFCSNSCRVAHWKKKHPKPRKAAEPVLEPIICEHCGLGALVPAGKGRKYCSATCRTLAYEARRTAAIEALSGAVGMSATKAADVIESGGMREITRLLNGLGMTYDPASRQWGVLVNESVFMRQESG